MPQTQLPILIGQYDSPFVRRVAIALTLYAMPFEHRSWSVFRDADRIAEYNPLRRVPTLVMPDGQVLVESTAILDSLDDLADDERRRSRDQPATIAGDAARRTHRHPSTRPERTGDRLLDEELGVREDQAAALRGAPVGGARQNHGLRAAGERGEALRRNDRVGGYTTEGVQSAQRHTQNRLGRHVGPLVARH